MRPVLLLALSGIACDTALPTVASDASPSDASRQCAEATSRSDLAWLQANVFYPRCGAFGSCHKGPAAQEGLRLDSATYTLLETRNVAARQVPAIALVAPGEPAASYFLIKLGYGDQSLRVKDLMPYRNETLCPEMVGAVERWIRAGAPEAGAPDAATRDAATTADAGVVDGASISNGFGSPSSSS